ncbi:MAG: sigma-70 family RNA polymerase sigma factor [Beijerinckiaceae bacterium]|nr:sigma-70 family RNA polymerase sigma factor [Beijerinckiaceae bacterium]
MSAANTALADLYEAHASELHGFARRRVGRQEADDIVQDAYLHLLQRGTAATLEHPRPYLYRIAANLAVDWARKAKIRLRYTGESLELSCNAENPPSPEAAAVSALELQRVQASLAELPQACRKAFLLNRVEDLSYAEIARRLGISVRTVDRHMARALAHLHEKLGPRYEI